MDPSRRVLSPKTLRIEFYHCGLTRRLARSAVILTRGCRISLAAVGGNSTGTAGDQGKKKGNVGEHGGISDFPGAGNGLDGFEGLDTNVECCSLEEVRAWGSSFDRLMKSAAGRNLFNEFLKSEYSEENIAFWMACEQLKRESNPKIIVETAKYIYNNHISIISPKEVSTFSVARSLSCYFPIRSYIRSDKALVKSWNNRHRDCQD